MYELTDMKLIELYNDSLLDKGWLTVYETYQHDDDNYFYIRSALIKRNIPVRMNWQWEITSFDYPDSEWRREDNKFSHAQVLVINRNYLGYVQNSADINQIFLLFHNLIREEDVYKKILIDYDTDDVIRIKNNKVQIKWKYLNDFLLHHKFNLMIYFSHNLPGNIRQSKEENITSSTSDGSLYYWHYKSTKITKLEGKKILKPKKKSKLLRGEEFIIDIDKQGYPIYLKATYNNIHNNQLKLVYFKKNVLTKYREKYNYFTIEPMSITSKQWRMQIGNNHPGYVSVLFPHLIQQLPLEEHAHWKIHNIEPQEPGITRNERLTIADGVPHQPDGIDHKFKIAYQQFSQKWDEKYSFPLIRALSNDDEYCFQLLTIVYNDTQEEFDKNIGFLSKIIIESINIKKLKETIRCADEDNSISILEKYLLEKFKLDQNILDYHIIFLRDLNNLRQGHAHRKPDSTVNRYNYNTAKKKFGIGTKSFKQVFEEILQKSLALMVFFENCCDNKGG